MALVVTDFERPKWKDRADDVKMKVDVAICTFRRSAWLADCVRSVAAQRLPAGAALRIIVADNNSAPLMRDAVADLAGTLTIDIAYVHAPAANISIARNACLDAATGEWLVFIDDDELAEPDWLARLLAGVENGSGQDIVFGVSEPVIPPDAPGWSRSGEFHANRLTGNDQSHNGYTCNVAMRRSAVQGLRFAIPLGKTGGEDTLFFHQANERGLRFGYAPDAVVRETIPSARATLGWLVRRRFRSGQIHHMLFADRSQGARVAAFATIKAAWCVVGAIASIWSPQRSVRHLSRGVFHGGVVLAALGKRPLEEYAADISQPISARGVTAA